MSNPPEVPTSASTGSNFGSRCEFKTYHTVPNKEGRLRVKPIVSPFENEAKGHADSTYALVINREFTVEDQSAPKSVTLKINSPHLLKVFRDVVRSYPSIPSDFKSPFEIKNPFQMLVHYWDELEEYRKGTTDNEARMHLNLLFQFMDNEIGPDRTKIMSMIQKGQITFLSAWVVFRPRDILYTTVMGHGWLMRCVKTVYEENTKIGPYFEVYCRYTDYDGKEVGDAGHKVVLVQKRDFGADNPANIMALEIFPRKYIEDDSIEERYEKRGEKFLDLRGCSTQSYEGLAQYLKDPPWSWWDYDMASASPVWLPYTETGRVVLDKATFKEDHPNKTPAISKANPELAFCPPFVIGYSLAKKEWCRFLVPNLTPVKWKEDAWDKLILEEEQKLVLQALVTSHSYPENARDQPEQKGKGLVILLHGSPGSGKTLSAESSAEMTHKALISASMASLDTERMSFIFERNLRRLLQYATLWKAIVLLDEADVFLEMREEKAGNADRNALVAIFLKELEYFSGIIFLTTNRVETFDWAMKSRIHLALGFSPPGTSIRQQMWTQALRTVPADELGIDDIAYAAQVLAERNLNGREIYNTLNTARTIATFEQKKLLLEHLQKILKVRDSFDKKLAQERVKLKKSSSKPAPAGHQLMRRGSILTEEPEEYQSD
ncbi:P-loop containing nucleoside triphosphate hydrolase protein [Xylaria bambusicola]|uniref:P-loop containing nucleoside triphosphate hydrolase protein n=1 Tax=Xylaria bambusicola TaxID=326684 RepID=UPI002007816E|nr:P-loop containing nucleoside triphosphate hydrolase protein [Xylaria bambusicola]KAI0509213.1 P-loop containing nucleoside triphosphate hydrolase protein [Xylaria bambusicola]